MHFTLVESSRSLLQTTECALLSVFAHGVLICVAAGLTAGGRQLPTDEREARVFFLLPPDRVAVQPYQTETFQLGRLGVDFQDGADLTHASPGPRVRPQALSARGKANGTGAQGLVPFGPVDKLAFDSVFSVLEVDRTVERYEWSAAPAYPPELIALGTQGVVQAIFVVDTAGAVDTTSVRVIHSDHPAFTASVRAALGAMRFHPALRRGKPVRQEVAQQFRFRIRPNERVAAGTPS